MMNGKKVLVAYFSASGQTEGLAKIVARVTGGDLFKIEPETPYTDADLDWNDAASRSTIEMKDLSARPAIASHVQNMDAYSIVFLGFPIWWYVAPRIIQTFLEGYDFADKTIIPFATSGSSGMGGTDMILRKSCGKKTTWRPSRRFATGTNDATIKGWVDSLKL